MHFKFLLIAFMCLLSISMIYHVATHIAKATPEQNLGSTFSGANYYLTENGTEPDGGDPIGGGWPK